MSSGGLLQLVAYGSADVYLDKQRKCFRRDVDLYRERWESFVSDLGIPSPNKSFEWVDGKLKTLTLCERGCGMVFRPDGSLTCQQMQESLWKRGKRFFVAMKAIERLRTNATSAPNDVTLSLPRELFEPIFNEIAKEATKSLIESESKITRRYSAAIVNARNVIQSVKRTGPEKIRHFEKRPAVDKRHNEKCGNCCRNFCATRE